MSDPSTSTSGDRPEKRRRGWVACLQCRERRTKCDASASPNPCHSCRENNLTCEWPAPDSIKKRGRKSRSQQTVTANYAPSWSVSSGRSQDIGASSSSRPANLVDLGLIPPAAPIWPITSQYHGFDPHCGPGFHPQDCGPSPRESEISSEFLRQFMPWTPDGHHTTMVSPNISYTSRLVKDAAVPMAQNALESGLSEPTRLSESHPGILPKQSPVASSNFKLGTGLSPVDSDESTRSFSWVRKHVIHPAIPGLEQRSFRKRLLSDQTKVGDIGDLQLSVMDQLVELFFIHLGSQFPSIERNHLQDLCDRRQTSSFLLLAVAAVSARFSAHSNIALKGLEPYQFGENVRARAMTLVGAQLLLPSCETVVAFLLLALAALGSDSIKETWMLVGMAVRMSQDMDLHRTPNIQSPENEKLNRNRRLTFWSVVIVDYSLCLAEGRPTSLPASSITQSLPSDDDVRSHVDPSSFPLADTPARSPFPNLARTVLSAGPVIDALNSPDTRFVGHHYMDPALSAACAQLQAQYDDLDIDLAWNAVNLLESYRARHGSLYLFLHVLNHALQVLVYQFDPPRDRVTFGPSGKGAPDIILSVQDIAWLHSPRFIGDMLVLANLIDPNIYMTMPLITYPFLLAKNYFERDKQDRQVIASRRNSDLDDPATIRAERLFAICTEQNIGYFTQALADIKTLWLGVQHLEALWLRTTPRKDADPRFKSHSTSPTTLTTVSLGDVTGFAAEKSIPGEVSLRSEAEDFVWTTQPDSV